MEFKRIFIATRGAMARRLVAFYREQEVESVLAFAMAEAEQAVLDDADFDAYLPGETWEEAWLHSERIVSAAMDAGCDALHPGAWMMAGYRPFVEMAVKANIPVVGVPLDVLRLLADRNAFQALVADRKLTILPTSGVLGSEEDGLAAAARVGLPAMVRGVGGRGSRRVSSFDQVPAAVAAVRDVERRSMFAEGVFLTRVMPNSRVVSAVVAGDIHGQCRTLGWLESVHKSGRFTWVDACGQMLDEALSERLEADSEGLAAALGWRGVGRFRWLIAEDGEIYFVDVSARLPMAIALFERVYGLDLVATEHRLAMGEGVHTLASGRASGRHGVQARVYAEPTDAGEDALLGLTVPDGALLCRGLDIGSPCNRDTEPLLAAVGATGTTSEDAFESLVDALRGTAVEGVSTNLSTLRDVVADGMLRAP